jgi:hypothetical protein
MSYVVRSGFWNCLLTSAMVSLVDSNLAKTSSLLAPWLLISEFNIGPNRPEISDNLPSAFSKIEGN